MAGSGFCTIVPGYSRGGDAWHAGDILDVDLDQTESMLIWMRESGITSGQVGLYGTSRGAEHALLVTSLMARDGSIGLPDAVAVHAPSDTIVGAFSARKVRTGIVLPLKPTERAWRWRGESDALAPGSQIEIERYDGPGRSIPDSPDNGAMQGAPLLRQDHAMKSVCERTAAGGIRGGRARSHSARTTLCDARVTYRRARLGACATLPHGIPPNPTYPS